MGQGLVLKSVMMATTCPSTDVLRTAQSTQAGRAQAQTQMYALRFAAMVLTFTAMREMTEIIFTWTAAPRSALSMQILCAEAAALELEITALK